MEIVAYDYDSGRWINQKNTDQSGTYTVYLNRPYSGTCGARVYVYNGNYINEYYNNKRAQAEADPILADPFPGVHHVTGIDFQLDEGGQISGVVDDSDGNPIPWISSRIL